MAVAAPTSGSCGLFSKGFRRRSLRGTRGTDTTTHTPTPTSMEMDNAVGTAPSSSSSRRAPPKKSAWKTFLGLGEAIASSLRTQHNTPPPPIGSVLQAASEAGTDRARHDIQRRTSRTGSELRETVGVYSHAEAESDRTAQLLDALDDNAPPDDPGHVYVVRADDTVNRVALRLGLSTNELRRDNHLFGSAQLFPGQILKVRKAQVSALSDEEQRAASGAGSPAFMDGGGGGSGGDGGGEMKDQHSTSQVGFGGGGGRERDGSAEDEERSGGGLPSSSSSSLSPSPGSPSPIKLARGTSFIPQAHLHVPAASCVDARPTMVRGVLNASMQYVGRRERVYTVHCTLYTVHCTLCVVLRVVWWCCMWVCGYGG